MILWMLWATSLGLLFGVAGILGEWMLRAFGRPGRSAWLAAAGASAGLPAWSLLRPPIRAIPLAGAAATAPSGAVRAAGAGVLSHIEALLAASPPLLRHADPFVIGAWVAASVTLAVAVTLGLSRIRRRSRRWPTACVGGGDVLVSEDFGPALLGLRAPRVVIPRWALVMDRDRLAMAWAHEDEHRAAGDGWLFLVGALALVLAPWNVALWWQMRRLRAAAEVDCDARVLRRGFAPAAYGALLLDVGSRSSELPFPVAALSRTPTLLERRLRMIVNGVRKARIWTTAVALAGVVALVAVACEAPTPTGVQSATKDVSARTGATELKLRETLGTQPKLVRLLKIAEGAKRAELPDSLRPLFVVDGVVGRRAIFIDPKSIHSISVFKGETAVKRYGARGAHGVIVITTKAGGGGGGH